MVVGHATAPRTALRLLLLLAPFAGGMAYHARMPPSRAAIRTAAMPRIRVSAIKAADKSEKSDAPKEGPSVGEIAGGAVALKVASSVAIKFATAAATVAFVSPVLKVAGIGAGLVQVGVDKYEFRKKQRLLKQQEIERNETIAQCRDVLAKRQAKADALAEDEVRLADDIERLRLRRDAIDRALTRLPSTGKKTTTKVAVGAVLGATIGTLVSARCGRRVMAAIAAVVLLTQVARRTGAMANAAVEDRAIRYGAVVILARNARGAVTAAERDLVAAMDAG